ncbi:MAG: four helix bundle protein [Pirellulaceae bacterium]|nr:four helix bundle protein [Pirellulaceae bacterium]
MAFAFEKLLVYQKSVDFADQICDLTEQFPARYNHLAERVRFQAHPSKAVAKQWTVLALIMAFLLNAIL